MATPRLLSLSRNIFTNTTTTTAESQTLTSLLLSRFFSAATTTTSPTTLLRLRPLASAVSLLLNSSNLSTTAFRTFATRQNQNSLSDNNQNLSNRPPKETILLDGCDFEHWLVVTDPPPEGATREEIIDSFIKTLAQVIGSEEEARMKIYSVSTRHYFAFGALVNEDLSIKLKELPNVRWVLPDSYLDVRNKDYGGEPFINGQAVPYDPKYHEEWVRNNAKAQERNRRNDRPRNVDRSRNFDRRQGGMPQNYQNNPASGGNMGGPPPSNAGYAPPNNAGYAQNAPPNNAGYGQNMAPPSNAGYGQNMPQGNPGYAQNRGPPPTYGVQGNRGQYQTGGGMPYQNNQNYAPQNSNMGGQQDPHGVYQQNMPGTDGPNN